MKRSKKLVVQGLAALLAWVAVGKDAGAQDVVNLPCDGQICEVAAASASWGDNYALSMNIDNGSSMDILADGSSFQSSDVILKKYCILMFCTWAPWEPVYSNTSASACDIFPDRCDENGMFLVAGDNQDVTVAWGLNPQTLDGCYQRTITLRNDEQDTYFNTQVFFECDLYGCRSSDENCQH